MATKKKYKSEYGLQSINIEVTDSNGANPILFENASNTLTIKLSANTRFTLDSSGNLLLPGKLTATSKSFMIEHPDNENMYLMYGSLEGPENGVYTRGVCKNTNIIQLPLYWKNLVDLNNITVLFTPMFSYQELYLREIDQENLQIIVDCRNRALNNLHFSYSIFAERIDIEMLEVEIPKNIEN